MEFEQPDVYWEEIKRHFRRACLLRQEGRHEEAAQIMRETLPPVIEQWNTRCPDSPMEKRHRLEALFAEEMKRVEDACFIQETLLSRLQNAFGQQVESAMEDLVRRIGMDGRISPAEVHSVVEPVRQELERMAGMLSEDPMGRSAPGPDLQAIVETLRQDIRAQKAPPVVDQEAFIDPLREELHGVMGPIKADLQALERGRQPALDARLGPMREELRSMFDDFREEMRRRERTHASELRTLIKSLKLDLAGYAETPGRELASQLDAFRGELMEAIGRPREALQRSLEPLRDAVENLARDSAEANTGERLRRLEAQSERAIADNRELLRRYLDPIREDLDTLREVPNAQIQGLHNVVISILKSVREFPHEQLTEDIRHVRNELRELGAVPIHELHDLIDALQETIVQNGRPAAEIIQQSLVALRADLEMLWANPNTETDVLLEGIREDLKQVVRYPADRQLADTVAPLAEDVHNLRQRVTEMARLLYEAADTVQQNPHRGRNPAEAPQAGKRAVSAISEARERRRKMLEKVTLEEAEPVTKVPFEDLSSAIDAAISEGQGQSEEERR